MFSISNNIITINRGDTAELNYKINRGTPANPQWYELENSDKLVFILTEPNKSFDKALLRKVYSAEDKEEDGTINIKFRPNDTYYLLPGTYYYEIKLCINESPTQELLDSDNSIIETVSPKRKFIILD